jgi:hypothetical protein
LRVGMVHAMLGAGFKYDHVQHYGRCASTKAFNTYSVTDELKGRRGGLAARRDRQQLRAFDRDSPAPITLPSTAHRGRSPGP